MALLPSSKIPQAINRRISNGKLAKNWQAYHGSNNWEGLLEPLDADLRAEILKYGDLSQLTYDAFDKEQGKSLWKEEELLHAGQLTWTGYTVSKFIYATSDVWWAGQEGRETAWMGYVAVATDEEEIARLGRRDIVIAWRGTILRLEWLEDLDGVHVHPVAERHVDERAHVEPIPSSQVEKQAHVNTALVQLIPPPTAASHVDSLPQQAHLQTIDVYEHSNVAVERGFYTLYTSSQPNGYMSAAEQVREEVKRLVELYKGKGSQLSITMTGHSLGGALALLAGYDVALNKVVDRDVPISVISFAGPRVGNNAFKRQLEEMGVKVLLVVNINDIVPKVPGLFIHEPPLKPNVVNAQAIDPSTSTMDVRDSDLSSISYVHVGTQLRIDNNQSPFLKRHANLSDCHNLEVYLHLVSGYRNVDDPFVGMHFLQRLLGDNLGLYISLMTRDVVLVNKGTNLLLDELHVPANWKTKKLPRPSLFPPPSPVL